MRASPLQDVVLPLVERTVRPQRVRIAIGATGEEIHHQAAAARPGHDAVSRIASVEVEAVRTDRAQVRPTVRRVLVLAGLENQCTDDAPPAHASRQKGATRASA